MQDTLYGELRWQSATGDVPLPLMESVATMLGRGSISIRRRNIISSCC